VTVRRLALLGRLLGGALAVAGLALVWVAVTAGPVGALGSQPFAVGPLTGVDLFGLGGGLVALGALPVVAGRGRDAAVSLGGLVAGAGVVLALLAPPDTRPYLLGVGTLGLALVAAGSLATARDG
jgi:hypothetical protein